MRAVLLDKATIGNDISFKGIQDLCELITYDITEKTEVKDRITGADIIISNKVIIGRDEMDAAKHLKLICVAATGYNNIDINEAKKRNIVVANVKAYSTESVAQSVFGYMLTIMNSVFEYAQEIKNEKWQQSPIFTILGHPFHELKGQKLGIIGYGSIGKRVAEIAEVFGMKVLISESIIKKQDTIQRIPFNDVLKQADILSIHTPLAKETENLITINELRQMKSSAVLINTSRGGVVNENDLYIALKEGIIRYAAVDVLTKEPPSEGNILFKAPNILITPHTAWTSIKARENLVKGIINNIKLYSEGDMESINLC